MVREPGIRMFENNFMFNRLLCNDKKQLFQKKFFMTIPRLIVLCLALCDQNDRLLSNMYFMMLEFRLYLRSKPK